ncbi:branched-chain amino acid transport system II carrier protein [Arcanobacterium hippocoleae]|uniref:branched-chain amino acid transport system II carrier protein n=1 Tax=Arcanobacterium hippocoleae TaxID=149017 RepID=UPI00333F7768
MPKAVWCDDTSEKGASFASEYRKKQIPFSQILVIGFALFAMFFGAGNLIFPVMVGADSGSNVIPVTIGLLLTSVVLPVLGMVVAATESTSEAAQGGVSSRIGKIPGTIFTLVVFLTTGMLYAVPRVATVAYEMSTAPLIAGVDFSAGAKLFCFTIVFFAVTVFFVLTPSAVVDRVGKYLSPALLVFLALLVCVTAFTMPDQGGEPSEKWLNSPFVAGAIEGYNTMDALATFVFGVVIVQSLQKLGANTPGQRVKEMTKVGLVAGVCLALVYIGLTVVGTRQAGMGFKNGAELLAAVSGAAFGSVGQIIFSIITILACLTTAIGLLTAATEYYKKYCRVCHS